VRVVRVTAHAFGPLSEQSLALGPGMNLIYGPNEAGKSSWHAALFAAICGMRRGRLSGEERAFRERHHPWSEQRWAVSAQVDLEDGRRIELRHDLDGRIACSAVDIQLGRDCSAEIMSEGTPDASRWLGLDRGAFLATAWVRQSDILRITADPGRLQSHLQRAATATTADTTATEALANIDAYRRQNVGSSRTNATGPLRRAMDEVHEAESMLERAQARHGEYLALMAERAEKEREAAEAERAWRIAVARRSAEEAEGWRARLARAEELSARVPSDAPPADTLQDELATGIDAALRGWDARPGSPPLTGPSSQELRMSLQRVRAHYRGARPSSALAASAIAGLGVGIPLLALGVEPLMAVAASVIAALAVGLLLRWVAAHGQPPRAAGDPVEALQLAIDAREAAERAADDARARIERLSSDLRAVAAQCGIETGGDDEEVARRLRAWHEAFVRADAERRAARAAWSELATLLDGGTIDGLRAATERRIRYAEETSAGLDPADIAAFALEGDADAHVARLEQAHRDAQVALAAASARLEERTSSVLSVAEAEEAHARAQETLSAVRRLDRVLDRTAAFLTKAQERVHRDIAPIIRSSIERWLPEVTAGRYSEAMVDPGQLDVRVRDIDGEIRRADSLSHGTAEQVYLLLRVALAEHLTAPGETCPLILDDVTVHCDDERTVGILRTLQSISQERQIILFTMERRVLDWCTERLPPDCIHRLPPPPVRHRPDT